MKKTKNQRREKFPVVVKRGSVTVKIYHALSHGSDSFTVSYYQDGLRKRSSFPNLETARLEAEAVAGRLASSDADVLTLTSADRAAYLRARQVLEPLNAHIEVAAAQFADATSRLGDVPISHAVDFYLKRHHTKIEPRLVADIVAELISAKVSDGLSERYIESLRWGLGKFADAFNCSLGTVSGNDVDQWLRGLCRSPRTRNNLRSYVQTLFNFAKARRYIAKDNDELDSVVPVKNRGGKIEVFSPPELGEILSCAGPSLIPFFVLGAFAGVRHAEIQRLDWKKIRFDDKIIEIEAGQAKTASRRIVPILENLREWLLPLRKATGLLCPYQNMTYQIKLILKRVNRQRNSNGVKERFVWKQNALRHSFISYRVSQIQNVPQVALEAGNSPAKIFSNYRELVRPADAEAWFALTPAGDGKVVALPRPESDGQSLPVHGVAAG